MTGREIWSWGFNVFCLSGFGCIYLILFVFGYWLPWIQLGGDGLAAILAGCLVLNGVLNHKASLKYLVFSPHFLVISTSFVAILVISYLNNDFYFIRQNWTWFVGGMIYFICGFLVIFFCGGRATFSLLANLTLMSIVVMILWRFLDYELFFRFTRAYLIYDSPNTLAFNSLVFLFVGLLQFDYCKNSAKKIFIEKDNFFVESIALFIILLSSCLMLASLSRALIFIPFFISVLLAVRVSNSYILRMGKDILIFVMGPILTISLLLADLEFFEKLADLLVKRDLLAEISDRYMLNRFTAEWLAFGHYGSLIDRAGNDAKELHNSYLFYGILLGPAFAVLYLISDVLLLVRKIVSREWLIACIVLGFISWAFFHVGHRGREAWIFLGLLYGQTLVSERSRNG